MRTHFINLPDQDLAYLPEGTKHYDDYVEAVGWAQKFARLNRDIDAVMEAQRDLVEVVHTLKQVVCVKG